MDNIIKRIIEIDKQARLATEAAIGEKENVRISIEQQKREVYDEYLQRSKQQTEKLMADFDEKSLRAYENAAAFNKKEIERLDGLDAANHQKWVEQLFAKVIE
ncbi:MAG: hypothetical protein IKS19_04130 [Clostridia bacterium]|nr:hypothetical protein [Clostridia bacterium]